MKTEFKIEIVKEGMQEAVDALADYNVSIKFNAIWLK